MSETPSDRPSPVPASISSKLLQNAMETPSHVPQELVFDFDYRAFQNSGKDLFTDLKKSVQDKPEIFWSPYYGGHWVINSGEIIRDVLADHRRFSSRYISIPFKPLPTQADPPEHRGYRRLVNEFLNHDFVERTIHEARLEARRVIQNFYQRGHCDFVAEFAQEIPLQVFLRQCHLNPEEHPILLQIGRRDLRRFPELGEYFLEIVKQRRQNPKEDLFNFLISSEIEGRPTTDHECVQLALGIILGALETVGVQMSWMMMFLATHPESRRQLVQNPELIPNAIQEVIRRFSGSNIIRIAKEDMVYKGIQMKATEGVVMLTALHGLDEKSFSCPMKVDYQRQNASSNSAFSQGIHGCPGRGLALGEMQVFLEEWLKLIPDFEMTAEPKSGLNIVVYMLFELQLAWKVNRAE